jgi:hypothetical protein
MKKYAVWLALLVVSATLLTGCDWGHETGSIVYGGRFEVIGDIGEEGYDVLRDRETGCVYVEATNTMGMSPLFDEEGKVEGCGKKNFDKDKY